MAAPSIAGQILLRNGVSTNTSGVVASEKPGSETAITGSNGGRLFTALSANNTSSFYTIQIAFNSSGTIDLSNKSVLLPLQSALDANSPGIAFGFYSASGTRSWIVDSSGANWKGSPALHDLLIAPSEGTYTDTGTFDITAVQGFQYRCVYKIVNNFTYITLQKDIYAFPDSGLQILGGDSTTPLSVDNIISLITPFFVTNSLYNSFPSFFSSPCSLLLGNGSTTIVSTLRDGAISFRANSTIDGNISWLLTRNPRQLTLNSPGLAISGEIFVGDTQTFKLNASTTPLTIRSTNFINYNEINIDNKTFIGCLLKRGKTIQGDGTLQDSIVQDSTDTVAAFNWTTSQTISGTNFTNNTIPVGAVKIATAGIYYLSNNVFSGNTKDFNITATTGTVTIIPDALSSTDFTGGFTASGYIAAKVQTAGATVVIQAPAVYFTAPNFQQGTSVEVSRIDTYTLASSGINTGTGVVTLSGHRFSSGSVPSLVAIVAQAGATMPTASVPLQRVDSNTGIVLPLLLSVVNVSGNTFQLAANDGGTPITFSSAGSGNFTIQGWTRLDFSVAGGGGYSKALVETNGALLQLKARYWQNSSGCTASTFFQNNYVWNSTTGIPIPDVLSVTATPDTFHNRLIGATITSATGNLATATTDGSTVAGMSADQSGVLTFNRSSGTLLVLDAYAWFVYYSSTSAGIRLVNGATFVALDLFDFVLSNVVLNNTNSTALQLTLAYVRSANGSRLVANGSNSLHLNVGQQGIAIQIAGNSTIAPSQQQIRDALALATSATVVSGSVDDKLNANLLRIE